MPPVATVEMHSASSKARGKLETLGLSEKPQALILWWVPQFLNAFALGKALT